jgi:hypothetical protein
MSTPTLKVNGSTIMEQQPQLDKFEDAREVQAERPLAERNDTNYSKLSMMSVPPAGSILTGKQEHCRRGHCLLRRAGY